MHVAAASAGSEIAAAVAAAAAAVVVVVVFPSFRCLLRLPRRSGRRFVRRLRRSRGVQRYIPARALPCAPDRAMGRNSASESRDVGIPVAPWVLLPHSVVSETPMRLAGLVLL